MARWRSSRLLAWGLAAGYLIFIFILSHSRVSRLPIPRFSFADKISHAVVYAGLSLLLWRAFRTCRNKQICKWAAVIALIAASLYGITDEWHQSWSPGGREADLWDWVADTVGAAAAALGAFIYFRLREKRRQKPTES